MRLPWKPKNKKWKIIFPPRSITARAWCSLCHWELPWSLGFYYGDDDEYEQRDDEHPKPTLEGLIQIWQHHHDEDNDCRFEISWEEINDGPITADDLRESLKDLDEDQ